VRSLKEEEAPLARHFTLPEIQYIGSDTGCGCGFPNRSWVMEQWTGEPENEEPEPEGTANLQALATLLEECGEKNIELYGIWLGRDGDFTKEALREERISLATILQPRFSFKERYLYRVNLEKPAS
jgi:hypothetical protein